MVVGVSQEVASRVTGFGVSFHSCLTGEAKRVAVMKIGFGFRDVFLLFYSSSAKELAI